MINNNKTIRKKFLFSAFIAIIINAISLLGYFRLCVYPLIERNNLIKSDIDVLITENDNYNDFINKFSEYRKKHKIEYLIKNSNYDIVASTNKKDSQLLYSNIITFDDGSYLLEIYLDKEMSIGEAITGFMLFQLGIVFIITIFITFFINRNIFSPIDKIIKDINNYKLGHRPKKIEVNGQIDLIQNEFVDLVDLLEEEKKEQNRIIASISHDIKTPLTSIIGYSNLINEGDLTKEQIIKYNDKINLKSKNIKEILNCFDDYLVNSAKETIKLKNILLRDLVKEINDDYLLDLEFRKINFNINCSCSDMYIKIDVSRIKRVIANIIQNSIRYINKDGVIIVNIDYLNNEFNFTISDNGGGVDKKIIMHIKTNINASYKDTANKLEKLGLSEMHQKIINEYYEIDVDKILNKDNKR